MTLRFDATPDELELFLDEAEEHLQTLDEGFLRLERQGDDPEMLQTIFRAAHTLKGSSGAIGHGQMQRLTHHLESVLDLLRNGKLTVSSPLIDTLLQSLDLLRLLNHQVRTLEDTGIDTGPAIARLEAATSDTRRRPASAAIQPEPTPPALGLSVDEEATLSAALTGGGLPYLIQVTLGPTSGLQAARALQIILELKDIGPVIHTVPHQEAIENEQLADSLRLLAVTQWEEPLIRGLLAHIGDVRELVFSRYSPKPVAIYPPALVAVEPESERAAHPSVGSQQPIAATVLTPAATAIADPPAARTALAPPPLAPSKGLAGKSLS